MSTNTNLKKQNKRIVFTMGANDDMVEIIQKLEDYYKGLNKAEILKISLLETYKKIQREISQHMTQTEKNIIDSIKSKTIYSAKNNIDLENYLNSL